MESTPNKFITEIYKNYFYPSKIETLKISELPPELALDIIGKCDLHTLSALSLTSISWNKAIFPLWSHIGNIYNRQINNIEELDEELLIGLENPELVKRSAEDLFDKHPESFRAELNTLLQSDKLSDFVTLQKIVSAQNNINFLLHQNYGWSSEDILLSKLCINCELNSKPNSLNELIKTSVILDKEFESNKDNFNSIVIIQVEDAGLTNFPSCLKYFHNLKNLTLSYNNFIFPIPEKLPLGLDTLVLNDNCINSWPTGIEKCTNLWKLNLSDNKLKTIPSGIGKLNKLVNINLSNCDLNEIPPDIIKLPLHELDLRGNHLPGKLNNKFIDKSNYYYNPKRHPYTIEVFKTELEEHIPEIITEKKIETGNSDVSKS